MQVKSGLRRFGSLIGATVLLVGLAQGSASAEKSDNSWGQFVTHRNEMLTQLAVPIEDCISRPAVFLPGYTSPMFGGCVDWHSNVHAIYSMYMIYGETRDVHYLNVAESKVKDELVPAELEYMKTAEFRGHMFYDLENPYGMAWMIDLAMKREEVTGNTSLRPLADYAASRIKSLLESLSPDEMRTQIQTAKHYNLTWGMIHLKQWADYTHDEALQRLMHQKAIPALLDPSLDQSCPATADAGQQVADETFYPPCLMRLAGVAQIWDAPHGKVRAWLNDRLPADLHVEALTNIDDWSGHEFGTNFSRAYTLWYLWKATNNIKLRDNYSELINYHMSRPEMWSTTGGYNISHFVPQFGVRAIAAGLDRHSTHWHAPWSSYSLNG